MNPSITQIVVIFISLIGAIITYFVIPLLKAKVQIAKDQMTENQAALLDLAIQTFCTAAEQIYTSAEGQKKKAWVLNGLRSLGYDVDTVQVDAAIEAFVYNLHHAINELVS